MCSTAPRRRAPPPAWPRGSCISAAAAGFQLFPWSWNRQHRFRPIPAKTSRRQSSAALVRFRRARLLLFLGLFERLHDLFRIFCLLLRRFFLLSPGRRYFGLVFSYGHRQFLIRLCLLGFPLYRRFRRRRHRNRLLSHRSRRPRQPPVRFERRLPAHRPAV